MRNSLRQFNCARCGITREICGRCDRGNIYCGPLCAFKVRCASLKASAKRYQLSFTGRLHHAKRQRSYRAHQRQNHQDLKIVTHQGSPGSASDGVLKKAASKLRFETSHGHCDFCGRFISEWLRLNFYKRRGGAKTAIVRVWPQGP